MSAGRGPVLPWEGRTIKLPELCPSRPVRPSDWADVQGRLRAAVSEPTYEIWLAPVHPHAHNGEAWKLGCPREIMQFLADRFGQLIQSATGCRVVLVACGSVS